jgi:hypothetical protein
MKKLAIFCLIGLLATALTVHAATNTVTTAAGTGPGSLTDNNITIDGYTQPGAIANTNSLHGSNTARLKICLTSTNGNALSMLTACQNAAGVTYNNFCFAETETAILGFFRASNVWGRGVAFLASPYTATVEARP